MTTCRRASYCIVLFVWKGASLTCQHSSGSRTASRRGSSALRPPRQGFAATKCVAAAPLRYAPLTGPRPPGNRLAEEAASTSWSLIEFTSCAIQNKALPKTRFGRTTSNKPIARAHHSECDRLVTEALLIELGSDDLGSL